MKICQFYKTNNSYKVVPMSRTKSGYYIGNYKVYICPINTDIESFRDLIFQSLSESKQLDNDEGPTGKEFLKLIKEKSLKGLYSSSNYCTVSMEDNVLTITPQRPFPKWRGIEDMVDSVIKLEYSKDNELAIAQKIIDVLEVSYHE